METVENLMVGKDADLALMVYETLVQSALHSLKRNIVAAVGENLPQTVELFGVVRQYQQPVALAAEAGEGVGDDVEILVVDTLRRAVEVNHGASTLFLHRSVVVVGGACGAEAHAGKRLKLPGEYIGVDNSVGRRRVALFRKERESRHSRLGDGAYALYRESLVAQRKQRFCRYKVEYALQVLAAVYGYGYIHAVELVVAQLGLYVEGAYRVYLVAEKVEAQRKLA